MTQDPARSQKTLFGAYTKEAGNFLVPDCQKPEMRLTTGQGIEISAKGP